jgi:Secretion system C-terminal sorting domain
MVYLRKYTNFYSKLSSQKNQKMRQLPFLIVLLSLLTPSLAQNYMSFPMQDVVWRGQYGSGLTGDRYDYEIQPIGDTIINAKTYANLVEHTISSYWNGGIGYYYANISKRIGGIREENKKIYFLSYVNGIENILYDFDNLAIGDTISHWHLNEFGDTLGNGGLIPYISDIDSIQLGGIYHKRYRVDWADSFGQPDYVIEGIGHTDGLLPRDLYQFESWAILGCVKKSNNILYHSDMFITCAMPTAIEKRDVLNFSVSPNPASTKLGIYLAQEQGETRFWVYDSKGIEVFKTTFLGTNYTLDLSNMSNGIYLLYLQNEQGYSSQYLIKQ